MHDCCPPYGEQRTSRPSYKTAVERVRPRNPPTFCRARGGVESKHRLDSSRMCREIGSIGDSAARVSPNSQALSVSISGNKRPAFAGPFMELAGLVPATSWVRSRRFPGLDFACLSAFYGSYSPPPTRSPTFCARARRRMRRAEKRRAENRRADARRPSP
jgi:hypothetical protein